MTIISACARVSLCRRYAVVHKTRDDNKTGGLHRCRQHGIATTDHDVREPETSLDGVNDAD